MKPKILLIALLAIVALGLLVVAPIGNSLFGGSATSPGFSSLFSFGPKEYFMMDMIVSRDSFLGKTFEVSNTSVEVSGACIGFVKVFGANNFKDTRCTIIIDGAKGKLTYNADGTLAGSLEGEQVNLDGSIIVPGSDKKIAFSIAPTDAFVSNYHPNVIFLEAATGELRRFKVDGNIDQTKALVNEKVELGNFMGNVRITFNTIVLNGFATKINWFN